MASSKGLALATIQRRKVGVPNIPCCASKLIGRSFGTARCAPGIRQPILEWCRFCNVVWPKLPVLWLEVESGCGPMLDSSVANSSDFLDQTRLGYVVVARLYPAFRRKACGVKFHKLSWGIEAGEFRYQPQRWKQPHRFVVIRRPIPEDPAEAAQLTLFKDRRYVYTVLATNLDLEPWRVWTFYRPRAIIEKDIRQLLYDLPLGRIPSSHWVANVAFFQLVLLAFNLVHWFKRLCLPTAWAKATVETVRADYLRLPAKLVRNAQGNVLQLPK